MSQVDEVWIVGFENGTKWFAVSLYNDGRIVHSGTWAVQAMPTGPEAMAHTVGIKPEEFTLMLDGGDVKHYKREVVKV